jgi:toxin YoeB
MRSLIFEGRTWEDYEELRQKDQKLHKTLRRQIKEMLREDPSKGTGKPEPLKHNFSGLWSRRISQKDRVVYKFDENYLYIYAIGGHYNQF